MINKKKIIIPGVVTLALLGICSVSASADTINGYDGTNICSSLYGLDTITYDENRVLNERYKFNIGNDYVYKDVPLNEDGRYIGTDHSGANLDMYYNTWQTINDTYLITNRQCYFSSDVEGVFDQIALNYTDFWLGDYELPNDNYLQPYEYEHVAIVGNTQTVWDREISITFLDVYNNELILVSNMDDIINRAYQEFETHSNTYFSMSILYDAIKSVYLHNGLDLFDNGFYIVSLYVEFTCQTFNPAETHVEIQNCHSIDYDGTFPNIVYPRSLYSLINNALEPQTIEYDYTSWLVTAVGGFLDTEIVPGFSIGGIFGVILMIALLSYILKMFLGG